MLRAMRTASSGMIAQQLLVDTIANTLSLWSLPMSGTRIAKRSATSRLDPSCMTENVFEEPVVIFSTSSPVPSIAKEPQQPNESESV